MCRKTILISLLIISYYSVATVYKCKNPKGEISFSDTPCQNANDKIMSIKKNPTKKQTPSEGNFINPDTIQNQSNKPIKISYNRSDNSASLGIAKTSHKTFEINSAYAAFNPKTNRMMVYLMPTEITSAMLEHVKKAQHVSSFAYMDSQGKARPYVEVLFIFEKGKKPILGNLKYHILHMTGMGKAKYSTASMSYPFPAKHLNMFPDAIERFKTMKFSNDGNAANLKLSYEFKERSKTKPYYWKFDVDIDVHIVGNN